MAEPRFRPLVAAATALLFAEGAALAQAVTPTTIWVEAATDDRRRGLSWSGGDAVLGAGIVAPVTDAVRLDAAVTTAREAPRHGGADATVDLGARYVRDFGGASLSAGVAGHLFPGAERAPGWAEATVGAGLLYGPVEIDLSAAYAPDQSAIGGDNLHLALDARAGVPATPWTLRAGVGRSSGSVDDPVRAQRLRPAGTYWNWRVGADYVLGPVTLGLDYHGNDIGRIVPLSPLADAGNSGDRLVARVSLGF